MSEMSATDLTSIPARAPAISGASAAGARSFGQILRGFIAQPAVAKSLPLLGLLGLLGAAAIAWMVIGAAPHRTLFAGLPDDQKAAVVEALTTAGVRNAIDRDTGAITVSDDDYHRARMLLASQNLPRGAQDGADVIGNMPLGSSRAVETERIRAAREADLARTIEAIDVVQSARVHLAVEQPSLFVREHSRTAASVMLTLAAGRTLGDNQVQAIVNLVASSVPGLAPDGVSVVDQNGRLLSHAGGGDGPTAASERQLSVQTQIEDRYRQAITSLLAPMLGGDNFTTEVHAEMDFSEVQSTREGFPDNQRALTSEQGTVSTDGATPGFSSTATGGAGAGGIPGALSNQPPAPAQLSTSPNGPAAAPGATPGQAPAAGAATADAGGRRQENYDRSFAVGREVSVTHQQTGTVKRLSVAVALRNPDGRPRGLREIQQIEELVKGAIGFDQARGDVVAINSRTFATAEEPTQSWWEAGWVSMAARNVTALVVAALLIFGLGKPLLRKSGALLANRAANRSNGRTQVSGEIANALADRARTDHDMKVSLEMIEATRDYEARAALIRAFVRQDPARAALVVRDLIRTDAGAANG
jgi:flagellar M-ring protein FliF